MQPMKKLKPPALKKGMTVGLIAPSGVVREENWLGEAVEGLEKRGYRVVVGESCTSRYGYLAGSDEIRAGDINRMFRDDHIDGIICIRGGYGATRIQHMLDYDAISKNPKVFSGYSDITALQSAFSIKTGLVSFHGSMGVAEFSKDTYGDDMHEVFTRCVERTEPIGFIDNPPGFERHTISSGKARGRLIGGNLMLLSCCCGTPYGWDFTDSILFFEEVNELTYSVDRMLTQLIQSGLLAQCRGIIIGDFKNCKLDHPGHALTLEEIYRDRLLPLEIPVFSGMQCGHCAPRLTLPFGVECEMDADKKTLEILESAVI